MYTSKGERTRWKGEEEMGKEKGREGGRGEGIYGGEVSAVEFQKNP